MIVSGTHIATCTQSGGVTVRSRISMDGTTMCPTATMVK